MSDACVVDVSLVAKWFLAEGDTPQAVALLNEWASAGILLIAPALLCSELANVMHRRVAGGVLTRDDARAALQTALGGLITFDHDPHLSIQAFDVAQRLSLPAAYDAHYLALAEKDARCGQPTSDCSIASVASCRGCVG